MTDYCKDCEHYPGGKQEAATRGCPTCVELYCDEGALNVGNNHPACAVFEPKKRTCGECVEGYWKHDDSGTGICPKRSKVLPVYYIGHSTKACDNFKGEADVRMG